MPEQDTIQKDDAMVNKILGQKEYFITTSRERRNSWTDYYEAYNGEFNENDSPYLSNLFIPKIHEAVELLAAFLAGKNQSITVSPEGQGDLKKAQVGQKLLDFQWRKVLFAQDKIIKWVKQATLFGNGYMKVGWDMTGERDEPFMSVIGLDQIFVDYYKEDEQESPLIHRIIRDMDEASADERYDKKYRSELVEVEDSMIDTEDSKFSAFDGTVYSSTKDLKRTEILEYWTADNKEVITLGNTTSGWQILRRKDNTNKTADGLLFKPFVKLKFKTSPLPNRAYDIGAIEPSIKIQLAFNDAVRAFLDNAMLINNKGWIVRRAARIAPMDLVRKPGFIMKVDDINADIRSEEVGDIKASMFEMIQFLDNEFQQASMVINLLKGISGADTATEAALGQQNVQTQLDLVDTNIKDGLSKVGQMLMNINISNLNKKQTIKIMEDDDQVAFMEIDPKSIQGKFDVNVTADRPPAESKAVRQKQLLDFLAIVQNDPNTLQKYPDLLEKIYKEYMRQGGFNDIEHFFTKKEGAEEEANPFNLGNTGNSLNRNEGLSSGAIEKSAINPAINPQSNI